MGSSKANFLPRKNLLRTLVALPGWTPEVCVCRQSPAQYLPRGSFSLLQSISIFFSGAQARRDRFPHIPWICMRTAFRKNAETPQTSDVTALVREPWSTFSKVLAGFPVFWCSSSREVLAHRLEAIYSLCVGKQHLCKCFFRDNWEVWILLGLLGGKALDVYLFLLLKLESNAPTTAILGREHLCFTSGLYILYKT